MPPVYIFAMKENENRWKVGRKQTWLDYFIYAKAKSNSPVGPSKLILSTGNPGKRKARAMRLKSLEPSSRCRDAM